MLILLWLEMPSSFNNSKYVCDVPFTTLCLAHGDEYRGDVSGGGGGHVPIS